MSNRNKGFDPLSSLFESPALDDDFLFDDEEDDEEFDHTDGQIDYTDPVFSPPPGMSAKLPPEEILLNVHTEEQIPTPEEQARIARELAQKALQQAQAAPEPEVVSPEEQARIARELAMKALQQAQPAPPKPSIARVNRPMSALEAARLAIEEEEANAVSPEEQARIARELAMKALQQAQAAAAPEPEEVSPEEQARIARELAMKALQKAKPPEPEAVSPEEQARIARELAMKALQKAQPAPPKPLAERAGRPLSALEAARLAIAQEEARAPEPEAVSPEEQARIARELAMKALQAAQAAAPEPEEVSPEEQARIARELAMKALQKAKPPEPEAVSPEEQARIARELAMKAMQRAQASKPKPLTERAGRPLSALEAARLAIAAEEEARAAEPEAEAMSPEEQARIARELAMKALQKAQPAEPAGMSPEEQARIARELAERALSQQAAEPVSEPEPELPKTLSERATRPLSALEAARAAAVEEEKQDERRRRRRVSKLTSRVRKLVPAQLPGLGKHKVANAILTDEREVLTALWKSHQAKFLSEGHIERAVAAVRVLHALEHCPAGHLIAAHVVTEVSDYLVWIDMSEESLVGAFSDARAWFASQ